MAQIEVNNLVKEFITTPKQKGLRGALRGLFAPQRKRVLAVDDISFAIEAGDIVGYVGPNGAGKSTTVKMLSGILHPTSGEVRIFDTSPYKHRIEVVRKLGVVFGQRTQLYWDLRLGESFELMRRMYQITDATFEENMSLMKDVLAIEELLNTPVRQLSLGQRMRGDLATAFLHSPPVLFLDEPTIGLDIVAKQAIRAFIQAINKERGTTVILTTHDLNDVEKLCKRLMIINHGIMVEDAPLTTIINKLAPYRILVVDFESPAEQIKIPPHVEITEQDGVRVTFRFQRKHVSASELIACVTKQYPIRDLSVQDPDIEDVISHYYKQ